MFRRVENQRRVKNGEPERRENLNKEQHSRSLDGGKSTCESFHPALLCRLFRGEMSSGSRCKQSLSELLLARLRRFFLSRAWNAVLPQFSSPMSSVTADS